MTNSYDEELSIGDRIAGRYEILSILGQGSMGVVYKCRHDILGRVVAIKTLRIQRNSDDRSQMRFEREARAASRLEHPNLITVHDFGYTSQGVPYLVMDFVSGTPLYDILKRERYMVAERAVNLFAQVCDGLYHAHQRGVIHRDLKPANILVVPRENDTETVKIVDLGVAKIVHGAEEESEAITRTGEVCGSPIYLSPEQCMYQELDARTDIYSLGVCMYESLTGGPPLRGATVYDTIYMHVHDTPRPFPPEMQLPRKLEEIIFRCLAKNPTDRFETMLQLKSELLNSMRTGPETSPVNVLPPDALFGPKSGQRRNSGETPRLDSSVRNSGSQQAFQQQAPRSEQVEEQNVEQDMRRTGPRKTTDSGIKRPTDSAARKPTDSGIKRPTDSAGRKSTDSGIKRPSDAAARHANYADDESIDEVVEPKKTTKEQYKSASRKAATPEDLSNPRITGSSRKGGVRDTAGGDASKENARRMTLLGLSVASILIGLGLGLGFAVYIINEQKTDTKTVAGAQTDDGLASSNAASPVHPSSLSLLANSNPSNPAGKKATGKKQSKNPAKVSNGKSPKSLEDVLAQSDAKFSPGPGAGRPQSGGSPGRFLSLMQRQGQGGHPQGRMPGGGGPTSLLAPGGMFNQQGGSQQMMPGMGQATPLTANNSKLQQTIMKMNSDPRFQQVKQLLAASSAGQQPQQGPPSPLGALFGAQPQQALPRPDNSMGASPLADFNGGDADAASAAMQASHEGFQFYADGNFEAACRKFEQANKLDPKPEYVRAYAQALNAYALTLNKQQKYAEAVHVEKKAVELAPDKKLYHDNLYRFSQNLENQRNGRLSPM